VVTEAADGGDDRGGAATGAMTGGRHRSGHRATGETIADPAEVALEAGGQQLGGTSISSGSAGVKKRAGTPVRPSKRRLAS
jgi:hypothetical protein